MSQDKIQLPDFLLADFYKQSLVIIDGEAIVDNTPAQEVKKEPETGRQWFLGSNLQKITLVVADEEAVYLRDESLQFLSSILGACKLNLGDVAIVNQLREPVDYSMVKNELSPKVMVLFGVTAKQIALPFTVPHYQVQQYDNCSFLLAPPLTLIQGNTQEAKLEKSKLWLSLKKIFNI